jgi:hypothetical protein
MGAPRHALRKRDERVYGEGEVEALDGARCVVHAPVTLLTLLCCCRTEVAMSSTASSTTLCDPRATPAPRRLCAISGLAFLACSAAGLLLANIFASAFYPSPFGPPFGPQTDLLAYFSANRIQVRAISFAFALAALALLVFVAYSAELFADTPSARRAGVSWLALGAGTLSAGFWLLTALLLWALSQPEVTEASGLLRTLHDLVYVSGGPAHILTLGVFLGAIAAAQWRMSQLPRWIIWTGAAAALLSVLAAFALLWESASLLLPLGRGLALLWIFAVSVALLMSRFRETTADTGEQGEPATRHQLESETTSAL